AQQKGIVQRQNAGLLSNGQQEVALDGRRIEAQVLKLRGDRLQRIVGDRDPPAKVIGQMQLMKRLASKKDYTLGGNSKRARGDPKQVGGFCRTQQLVARQSMQGQDGQRGKKGAQEYSFDHHRPQNLIEGMRIVEQADPIKSGGKAE